MMANNKKWGQNQSDYLIVLKDKWIKIAFTDGKVIKGVLTCVDVYEIFIKPAKGPEVMVSKGAIKYLHQTSTGNE